MDRLRIARIGRNMWGENISTALLLFNTATVLRSSGLKGEGVVRITQESGAPRENSVVWVTKKITGC